VPRWKLHLVGWLLTMLAVGLRLTWRVRRFGIEHRKAAEDGHAKASFCLALWHEQLFASILGHARQKIAPLASLSKDGELVTFVMDRIGFKTVRGSSSRGGEEARDELVERVAAGWFTAITVDGPRGPRRRVKGGVIDVARRTGVAVLPLITIADRTWILHKSWDQFQIPKPFARVALRYGPPVFVSEDTTGLAFGEAKAKVKAGLEAAEAAAKADLAGWARA